MPGEERVVSTRMLEVCPSITSEVLEDFAEMTRTEMVLIDADSTPRSVQRELRWNAAYHRLAQGL